MPIPPPNFVEPMDAVRRVCDESECTEAEAVRFLCDRWINGEITPRFIAGEPPGGADPRMADWSAGAIILPPKWLPRRAISEPGDDPEWQRIPGPSFPFKIDRQQLEAALKAAGDRQPSSSEKSEAEAEIDAVGAAGHHEVEPASDNAGTGSDKQSEAPHDTVSLRGKAKQWLAAHAAAGKHRDRNSTLEAMRAAHPGLGVRGSRAVWGEFTRANPHLQLSRRGAKLKRNANN
jgi:hypothetical protein